MQARRGFLLTLIWALILAPSSVRAQGMGEYAGINAGVAGMGAGVAASMHNGVLVRRTYQSATQAQQALMAQNHAVEQYLKLGTQFQANKQWGNAEKAFTYVLQVIARRDGPGSPQGVPALKHLVSICKAQNKIDEAISFQKTVLAFTQADKKTETKVLIKEQERLSNLFIRKSDYASAEPVLRNTVALYQQAPSPAPNYTRTLRVYGTVLRQLNKTDEAAQIESQLVELQAATAPSSDANTAPLLSSSTNANSPTSASVTDEKATANNQSASGNAISTLPEDATANARGAKQEDGSEGPDDSAHISPTPSPAPACDKISQDSPVATTPPDSSKPSSKIAIPDNTNIQARILPDSPDGSPAASMLPNPSSSSSSLPEPPPLPMPDGTQQAH